MGVHYDHIGTNEDGTPRFHIWSDVPDAHLVMTGPIVGTVEVAGETIDVSAPFIEVADEAIALAVSDAIGRRHVVEGHPDFVNDPDMDSLGFVHVASDGSVAISAGAAPETAADAQAKHGDIVTVEV